MQFTEVSELNHVIGMMRMLACNSPTFHDRQDSEVDRIYNSSPKMEMQMRNSWIDKMSSFKNLPTTNNQKKSPVSKNASSNVSDTSDGINTQQETHVSTINTSQRNSGHGQNRKEEKIKNDQTTTTTAIINRDIKANSSTSTGGTTEKEEDGNIEFSKEDIEPLSVHNVSLLDKALKGSTSSLGQKPVLLGNEGAVLHLTIYLPTRSEMKIDLYETSTVDESIQEILRTHHAENRQPPLYYGHPECYELRLHDAGGYPDEDFPALDRSRKIKNFGDAGGHEYCLCERPDACPPAEGAGGITTTTTNVTTAGGEGSDNFMATTISQVTANKTDVSSSSKIPMTTEKTFLKIFMPKSDDYTVVAIDHTTIGQDLLPTLNKKHRLQLFQDQYILKILEADRERLDLASDEIDLQTKLKPLGLHEVTLSIKQYADAPQVPVTVQNTLDDATQIDGRSRPPPGTFMFNDVTAAMFKEWRVIKKNKYGKKQQRMLGIDQHKIYNRKVGERAIKSRNTTKIAERPISSVGWVRFLQDPSEFQIYFKDIEEIITDYTAESPYECAEIVAKLKYILSRMK